MTPEEINRLIAEKVMGWVEATPTDPRRLYWKGSQGPLETCPSAALIGTYFDPYHRIDHAMMALEKFSAWELHRSTKYFFCNIYVNVNEYDEPLGGYIEGHADTAPAAISLALVEACKDDK